MSFTSVHLYAVGLALLTVIAATVLLQERRMPQSTLAWLLAILALPYLAAPLFLLLGARKFAHRRPRRTVLDGAVTMSTAGTFRALGSSLARDGNRVRLIDDPHQGWQALEELVAGSSASLEVEYYIISNDPEGRRFLDLLVAKAAAGVEVLLILDRIGSLIPPWPELRRLRAAGGQVRWFAPLINRWSRGGLNLRNHRKVIIADGARLMSGGMNVGADYVRLDWTPRPRAAFEDLNFWLEGPSVADFQRLFRSDWTMARGDAPFEPRALPQPMGTARVQLVASGPDRPLDALHKGLVQAIHRADRRVWLATPYFLPTDELLTALAIAGRRGLDVRLMVPERSNHWSADLARGASLRFLQGEGCRIILAPGMVHAKAGVIDGAAWVGTANLDLRSLLLNFEAVLMLHDATSVAMLASWFERHFAHSAEGVYRPALLRRLGEGLFRLGAPLL